MSAVTSTTLLREAHALLLRAQDIETYHAPATGLHTIAPRLYQIKAARVACEQVLGFPSAAREGKEE